MTDVVVEGDDLVHLATRLLLNLSYNADGLAVMKALGLCDILLAVLPVLPDVALVFALQLAGRLLPTCSDLPISNQNRWLHAATARLATAIQTAEDEADDAVAALSVLAEPLLQLVDHLLSPGSSDINKHVSQVLRRTDCVLGRQHPAAALLSRVQRRLGAATISAN
ncbi:hypothetical protein JM18_001943 [Phytophthora kernoviae]|uniref:Uncharacterized protein n=2 Tax=Phytophthora kernoviae TaxID=325452 RepID=A0A921VDS0_9STRA|nr:hypothetical protein G195_002779 [Phytophthora kernoviae 00238/432]KAG2530989.1 hypothetical protein JM18_001943 [Phytophthora kernoviae]